MQRGFELRLRKRWNEGKNSLSRRDGSFIVSGVPPGSYIVEISSIDYAFEPVRVDITSKGKIRARRLNLLQVSFLLMFFLLALAFVLDLHF